MFVTRHAILTSVLPLLSLNIIRILNNKLMNIERAFILPEGLPGRPYFK